MFDQVMCPECGLPGTQGERCSWSSEYMWRCSKMHEWSALSAASQREKNAKDRKAAEPKPVYTRVYKDDER